MGTQIFLIANGANISPELWGRVYTESLVLLESFPARLTRLEVQELRDAERYAFSTEIVRRRGERDEHWRVTGDLTSRREAEEFELFRHHARQFSGLDLSSDNVDRRDVLWAEADDRFHDFCGNGRTLWSSKTQGFPYHFALLAVGMLVESRCPGAAYVIGDIDRRQSEQTRLWANSVLDDPVDLPVCVDPDRLYCRVHDLYGDERFAFRRFTTLFRGDDNQVWPAIVRRADPLAVRRCLAVSLGSYETTSDVRASHYIVRYLEATGDLPGLIQTVSEIAEVGERDAETSPLEGLLETLCAYKVTIPLEERRVVPAEGLPLPDDDSDEGIWERFVRLISARPKVNVYVPTDELLEQFCQAEPHRRERFHEIVRESERSAREQLRWIASKNDELRRTAPSSESERTSTDSRPTGEAYIRAQIADQTPRYPDTVALVRQIGEKLREGALASPAIQELSDKDALLRGLYRTTFRNQILLTAPTWDRIDALEDQDLLKHLFAFALPEERDREFFNWRRYVLEEPSLWDALAGRTS